MAIKDIPLTFGSYPDAAHELILGGTTRSMPSKPPLPILFSH